MTPKYYVLLICVGTKNGFIAFVFPGASAALTKQVGANT